MVDPQLAGEILNQALPYIQRFRGQTFVVKYGGSAMRDPALLRGVIRNVLLMQLVGIRPIVVHGGGPEIDRWTERLGGEKKTIDGLRVTDPDTMEIVEMALGRTNKALVSEVQISGGRAMGVSGRDGGLFIGEPVSAALGRVGRIIRVDPEIVRVACDNGYVPVICTVAADVAGDALNVNADSAAAALAASVAASKLILLSDTEGVYASADDPKSLLSQLPIKDARTMLADGRASGGMIPKLEAALKALEDGVESVHLINGSRPNALLIEVFTDHGIGTMMRRA